MIEGGAEIEPAPEVDIPDTGVYLWDWYMDLSSHFQRVQDGVATPIAPSEYLAWVTTSGEIVYPREYAILHALDVAFCDEMNKELSDERERREDQSKRK